MEKELEREKEKERERKERKEENEEETTEEVGERKVKRKRTGRLDSMKEDEEDTFGFDEELIAFSSATEPHPAGPLHESKFTTPARKIISTSVSRPGSTTSKDRAVPSATDWESPTDRLAEMGAGPPAEPSPPCQRRTLRCSRPNTNFF